MYSVTKSIHVDFGHIVTGHLGHCAGTHGHTWCLEICVQARELNKTGFVLDFSMLNKSVLKPVFNLLDHAFAVDATTADQAMDTFEALSAVCHKRRVDTHGTEDADACALKLRLENKGGFITQFPDVKLVQMDGLKLVIFNFTPTSERLAKWLYDYTSATCNAVSPDNLIVKYARVYETLHPVPTYAEYSKE